MNNPPSIKQNARPDALPNFRNLGVTLRILLLSIGLALLQAILLANTWSDVAQRMLQIATLLTPVLLTSLMLLWLAQPRLNRLPYWQGVLAVMTLAVTMTLAIYTFGGELYFQPGSDDGYFDVARYVFLSALVCGVLLLYFRLRTHVLSLSLDDARLQVLRARIRPHFLFNTINAVLGIVRTQPKRAETALEDMADLFRMAMSGEQDLVPLGHEIQLSKQYVALEQMRMGERLQVDWQINGVPDDALIPPLLLQPLLENAVYHGIEPLLQGGCIKIELRHSGDRMQINVENPCPERVAVPHRGNMIALSNIRERLDLLFDVEASYQVERGKDFYRVEIIFPYVSSVKERPA
jgi:two-component system, LytTR family, sensor histidine kinase AlgZ